MAQTLGQLRQISVGTTVESVSVNYTAYLDGAETVSSVTSVTLIDPGSGLTISGAAVNATTYTEAETGDTVAVGAAVQFDVDASAAVAGTSYRLRIIAVTSGGRNQPFDIILVAV